jgi:MFS family permease
MLPNCNGDDHRSYVVLLTLCCLVTFGSYFSISMRLPVVPIHALDFGVTTAQIGAINAAFYLMAGILAWPSGMLSDRFGRKRLAFSGTAILFAGMLLLCFAGSFAQLAGVYLLLGVGIAAFGPTMMSWVAEFSPSTHMGRTYGWYTTALFCGLGMGPAAGGMLGEWAGYPAVFLSGATLLAATALALQVLLPARPNPGAWPGLPQKKASRVQDAFANRPLWGCWVVTFGANIMGGTFFTFMPLLAHDRGLTVGQIGIVYLVQSVANAVCRIPFGSVSDRLGRRHYQSLIGVLLATLSMAGFVFAASFVHFLAAALFLGLSLAIAFTSIGALIAETTESRFRGIAMGGYNSFIYFGLMAGSIGLGPFIESIGLVGGFALAAGINFFFMAFFGWSMSAYSRRESQGEPASDAHRAAGRPGESAPTPDPAHHRDA